MDLLPGVRALHAPGADGSTPTIAARRAGARLRVVAELALVVLLAVVVVLGFREPSRRQAFEIDESRWIATSRYFWTTFVDRDLFGEAWQPNYLVLTHPPVARYFIGFGLWLQGWSPDELNGRYDVFRDREANQRAGNIPRRALLQDARSVVFVFAVGAVLLLYPIGRALAGPLAGVASVGLAVANPLLSSLLTRALAEAPLAFFTLLALWLALVFVPRIPRRGTGLAGPIGVGVGLGLAAATKLSGVMGGVGLALFALIQLDTELRNRRRPAGLLSWLAIGIFAAMVFILVNPLLYPDPLGRTVMLFRHRQEEMQQQRILAPDFAVPEDLPTRAGIVAKMAFEDYGTFQRRTGLPLDAAVAAIGLGLILVATWWSIRRSQAPARGTLLLCWVVATYGLTSWHYGYQSRHYIAPLVTLNVILQALAITAVVSRVARLAGRELRLPSFHSTQRRSPVGPVS